MRPSVKSHAGALGASAHRPRPAAASLSAVDGLGSWTFSVVDGHLHRNSAPVLFILTFDALPSMEGGCRTEHQEDWVFRTALVTCQEGCHVILLNRPTGQAEESLGEIAAAATGHALIPIDQVLSPILKAHAKAAGKVMQKCAAAGGLDELCLNAGIMLQEDAARVAMVVTSQHRRMSSPTFCSPGVSLAPALGEAAAAHGEARVVSMSSGRVRATGVRRALLCARGWPTGGVRRATSATINPSSQPTLHRRTAREALGAWSSVGHRTPGVCGTDMFVHVQQLSRPGQPVDRSRVPSVEDGACAQLKCICDPSVRSGELWGPRGMGGPPSEIALAPPTVLVDEEAKTALWRACEDAVGNLHCERE